jgi:hypothetical protein
MLNFTQSGGAQKPDAVSSCKNLGALVTGIVDTCLMDRPTIGDSRGTLLWVDRWAASLSDEPETVLELVDTMSGADTETTDDCLTLMARILDEARMNQENEELGASDFFHVFELGLSERTEAGKLNAEICFGLCQAYLRAGLTPPRPNAHGT